jgi:hypothetical protein
MEPFAASASSSVIRPASAGVLSDASAVLRDGRILAGEVLANPGDGSVLLALGRHRVPAETNIALEQGDRFLVRVEGEGASLVLRLLRPGDPAVAPLLAALRQVVGESRPVGALLADLAARLRAEDASGTGVARLLAALPKQVAGPLAGGAGLLALLQRSGHLYEATLGRAVRAGFAGDLAERVAGDWKGALLSTLAQQEEGPVRTLLERTLQALEAEQLLNLARRASGEPQLWSFPFPDGSGWSTARVLFPPPRDPDPRDPEEEPPARVVVGVELSRLGPVRAELELVPDKLVARVLVTRTDVATRMQADLVELSERLAPAGLGVHLSVRVGKPEEARVASRPLDIGFLQDHRLMDVEG